MLALVGSTIWIFDTNLIILIPLFAFYLSKGRNEGIIFFLMSITGTIIFGRLYVLLLILSFLLYLIIFMISKIVFIDDVDSNMVACFISVFILVIERNYDHITLSYSFVSLGYALMSFWLYYIINSIDLSLADKFINKEYKLDIKVYQSSINQDYCGDCYDYFSFENKKYLLLSDGMYVGKNAYEISSYVLSSLRYFIENGKGLDEGIKLCSDLVNKKYECEEFSTLDLFELENNKLNIIKRGAENSLLIRNKDVMKISGNSLPVGVDGDCYKNSFRIRNNDILIMYSDGVKDRYPLFEQMVEENLYGDNLNGWMAKLLNKNKENQKDDFSIFIIKFVDIS